MSAPTHDQWYRAQRRMIERYGKGWALLSPTQQRNAWASEVLDIVQLVCPTAREVTRSGWAYWDGTCDEDSL